MRLLARIQILRRQHEQLGQATTLENLKQLQRAEFDKSIERDVQASANVDRSNVDWRSTFPDSYVLGSPMTEEQRLQVLRFSVMVVRNTYFIMNDSKQSRFSVLSKLSTMAFNGNCSFRDQHQHESRICADSMASIATRSSTSGGRYIHTNKTIRLGSMSIC
ncbi:hypothetical protein MRB53_041695 [Persea americana]|nr:hypothetical protein MRB53_041695 [Persea americana]